MLSKDLSNELKIREYPFSVWFFVLLLVIIAFYSVSLSNSGILPASILIAVAGVILVFFAPVKIYSADRSRGVFSFNSFSLTGRKSWEYRFEDIYAFEVEASNTYSRREQRNSAYRLVLVKKNGERVPLSSVYTTGYYEKEKKAHRLCEFMGLPVDKDEPMDFSQHPVQFENKQSILPEITQTGTTSGVDWWIEYCQAGERQVMHWQSKAINWPTGFLLILQKPNGSKNIFEASGLMGNLLLATFRHLSNLYGLVPDDLPGFEKAVVLSNGDNRLNQDYALLTSDSENGKRLLSAWVVSTLLHWAVKHPLRTISPVDQPGQLIILVSPNGLRISIPGCKPQQIDEVVTMGVDIVKAQGDVLP